MGCQRSEISRIGARKSGDLSTCVHMVGNAHGVITETSEEGSNEIAMHLESLEAMTQQQKGQEAAGEVRWVPEKTSQNDGSDCRHQWLLPDSCKAALREAGN